MSGSGEYISREAFLAEQRHLYCENCARRKGMKNGKMKFVYEIGDAPCRACGIGDVLDDVESFHAADVRPVVLCRDCKYWFNAPVADGFNSCELDALIRYEDFFCAAGEKREES